MNNMRGAFYHILKCDEITMSFSIFFLQNWQMPSIENSFPLYGLTKIGRHHLCHAIDHVFAHQLGIGSVCQQLGVTSQHHLIVNSQTNIALEPDKVNTFLHFIQTWAQTLYFVNFCQIF